MEVYDPLDVLKGGVVHLHYLKIRFSRFFNQQRKAPTPAPLEPAEHMMCRIREGDVAWAPAMSFALRAAIGVPALARMGAPSVGFKAPLGGGTAATAGSTAPGSTVPGVIGPGTTAVDGSVGGVSQMGTLSVSALTAMLKQARGGGTQANAGDGGKAAPMKNAGFAQTLFGEIQERMRKGKRIASRLVRDMITAGTLPPLPLSKVDGKAMCLAWHTKGMCNPGQCPRAADHVNYSVEEYGQLSTWCKTNYPKAE